MEDSEVVVAPMQHTMVTVVYSSVDQSISHDFTACNIIRVYTATMVQERKVLPCYNHA